MDLYEFKAILGYRVSSMTARATQRNLVSKTNQLNKKVAGKAGQSWCRPLIPALGRQRQTNL